jgi:DNA-binding NtrC family response regulator
MNIDIVDDEAGLREVYKAIIERAGFTVNSFACAGEYLAYTNSQILPPPSIAIITDVKMPGKSGYELIEDVQKVNPKQRFVVVTGSPQEGYKGEAKACFYLQKPVSIEKLVAVIKLLSACSVAGDQHLAPRCELLSDLRAFSVDDWSCPHIKPR